MNIRGTTDEQKVVPGENGPFSFARRSPEQLSAGSPRSSGGQLQKACHFPRPRNYHVPSCRPSQCKVVMHEQSHAGVSVGFGGGAEQYSKSECKRSRTDDQSMVMAAWNDIASAFPVFSMEHLLHTLMRHARIKKGGSS
jgi:hypothetical protein